MVALHGRPYEDKAALGLGGAACQFAFYVHATCSFAVFRSKCLSMVLLAPAQVTSCTTRSCFCCSQAVSNSKRPFVTRKVHAVPDGQARQGKGGAEKGAEETIVKRTPAHRLRKKTFRWCPHTQPASRAVRAAWQGNNKVAHGTAEVEALSAGFPWGRDGLGHPALERRWSSPGVAWSSLPFLLGRDLGPTGRESSKGWRVDTPL